MQCGDRPVSYHIILHYITLQYRFVRKPISNIGLPSSDVTGYDLQKIKNKKQKQNKTKQKKTFGDEEKKKSFIATTIATPGGVAKIRYTPKTCKTWQK